jgi:hypothetical protein
MDSKDLLYILNINGTQTAFLLNLIVCSRTSRYSHLSVLTIFQQQMAIAADDAAEMKL